MKPVNLSSGAARLQEALDALEIAWGDAKQHWHDESSRNFEENHVQPIGPHVRAALDAISRMHEVVARLRRDCEE